MKKTILLMPILMFGLAACGPTGGGDKPKPTGDPLVVIDTQLSVVDPTKTSGYAKYNGDHVIGDYTVTTSNILVQDYDKSNPKVPIVQAKKIDGTITINSIKVTKVVVDFVSTYDLSDNYITATFNSGEKIALTDNEITNANANKVKIGTKVISDTESYDINRITYTLNINAVSAGTLVLSGGEKGAVQFSAISIY